MNARLLSRIWKHTAGRLCSSPALLEQVVAVSLNLVRLTLPLSNATNLTTKIRRLLPIIEEQGAYPRSSLLCSSPVLLEQIVTVSLNLVRLALLLLKQQLPDTRAGLQGAPQLCIALGQQSDLWVRSCWPGTLKGKGEGEEEKGLGGGGTAGRAAVCIALCQQNGL